MDDEDAEELQPFNWFYTKGHALRQEKENGGRSVTIYMHRQIMDAPEGAEIDHINGNGLDNRKSNLRVCSHAENMKNRKKCSTPTSSEFKGVSWHKREERWIARVYSDGKCHNLGYFDSEIAAAKAYNEKAKKLHGEFCNLNPVPEATPA